MQLTVDGQPVFVATGGQAPKPERPAVVFLHGSGMDHTVWTLQTRYFAHHGRAVLAVDLPGHGRSGGTALGSVEALADWVLRLIAAAGFASAALVGHSMGALVALEAAARAPQRVWALGLLGIAERMPVHPDLLKAASANDHGAIDLVAAWGFGRPAHLGGARAPGTWMLGGGIRLLERAQGGVLAADLAACNAYQGAAAAAAKLRCPVLVLAGDADRMTSAAGAAALAKKIEGARTLVLPGAGHMMMVEQPDATLNALAEMI